jgi:hypothetical protein
MIDVHEPHETVHTWKDFFIHIATIVVGLCIAVGLEQTIEFFHHRRELRVAREELRADIEENRRITATDLQQIHQFQAQLNRDMAILLAHRATGKPLTAKLDFTWKFRAIRDAAWKTDQQSGVLSLMPHSELEHYNFIFVLCDGVMESTGQWNTEIEIAKAIANRSPDGQLTPQDTNELITAISTAQGKLAWTEDLIGFAQHGLDDHTYDH